MGNEVVLYGQFAAAAACAEVKALREPTFHHLKDCPLSWLRAGPGENELHMREGNTAWYRHPAVPSGWSLR